MSNYRQPRVVGSTAPPFPEKRREGFDHWYSFLEDECLKDNGLLCFSDRHKSREVAYFCGLLADCLTSGAGKSEEQELEAIINPGAMSDQGERSFEPLKVLSKA